MMQGTQSGQREAKSRLWGTIGGDDDGRVGCVFGGRWVAQLVSE